MNKFSLAIAAAAVTAFAGHAMAADTTKMNSPQAAANAQMAASGVQGTAKPDPRSTTGHTNMSKAMHGDKAAAKSGQTVEGTATPSPRPAAGATDVKKVVQGDKSAAAAARTGGTVQGEKNAKP